MIIILEFSQPSSLSMRECVCVRESESIEVLTRIRYAAATFLSHKQSQSEAGALQSDKKT